MNVGPPSGPFQRPPSSPSLTVKFPTQPTILTGLRLPGRGGSLATGSIFPQPGPLTTLRELLGIPEKRKVFVSYHHHGDQAYKDALLERYCADYDLLEDSSLERMIETEDLQYVERQIREDYIKGSSVTVLLCGARTWQRKFVDWELYATLLKKAGLVGIQLPTLVGAQVNVPSRFNDNLKTGYAVWKHWNEIISTPGILRAWVEEALAKESSRIANSRIKMSRNRT